MAPLAAPCVRPSRPDVALVLADGITLTNGTPWRSVFHRAGLVLALGLLAASSARPQPVPTAFLTPGRVSEDVDQFEAELEGRFAYLRTNDADYKSAIQTLRQRAASGMTVHELGVELKKVIALFIDGHAGIGGAGEPSGYLPFGMEAIGERFVALQPDRLGFVDPLHPYVRAIDGRTIADWRRALQVVLPRGSPQLLTVLTLRYLQYLQYARELTGLERASIVPVELESEDRTTSVSLSLALAEESLLLPTWPELPSRILEENVGYLRIRGWNEAAFAEVATWMPRFAGARGLIVDIRQNGGGTRNVLWDMYPYFVSVSDPPRVAGVAKYRLYPAFGPDHLESRHMHPLSWSGWGSAERAAITELMAQFEPEWQPPEAEFSEWHFWVLTKASNPQAFHFEGPIVFLMDQWCLSASDVILSAVKDMPNVTLVGEPSGGTSGAFVETTLANSGLALRLSSMASFQRTGQLYDGHGVQPDVAAAAVPEHFLRDGPDPVLALAIELVLR
jgi:hypothetical protein